MRDLEYMQQCALRGFENDPFLIMSSRELERTALGEADLIPQHVDPAGVLPIAVDSRSPHLGGIGRNA